MMTISIPAAAPALGSTTANLLVSAPSLTRTSRQTTLVSRQPYNKRQVPDRVRHPSKLLPPSSERVDHQVVSSSPPATPARLTAGATGRALDGASRRLILATVASRCLARVATADRLLGVRQRLSASRAGTLRKPKRSRCCSTCLRLGETPIGGVSKRAVAPVSQNAAATSRHAGGDGAAK
jgi:hypothetical protein